MPAFLPAGTPAARGGQRPAMMTRGRDSLVVDKRSRIAWVRYLARGDGCERREFVGLGVVGADDVEDLPALGYELVGDEAAVAAPGEGFGAHDGGARVSGEGL